jgi:hypothetical protein
MTFIRTYLFLIILAPMLALGQVDEASSETQSFSINRTSEASSGNLQFSFKKVEINDSSNRIFNRDFVDNSAPLITVITPHLKRGFKMIEFNKLYTISGKVEDESGIFEILVNNNEASVDADGNFWISIPLAYGDNPIEIQATDIHKNSSVKSFVIERKTAEVPTHITQGGESKVNWQLPSRDIKVSKEEKINIQACIQTSSPIVEINIYKNDWKVKTIYESDLDAIGSCKIMLSETIKLNLDINNIKIEVKTESGSFDAVREIEFNPITTSYKALIIAVQDYDDPAIDDLEEPINDAIKLYNVLTEMYSFKKEDVLFLKNATRAEILGALHELRGSITKNDNLLIFYAGHGHFDETMNNGYWLPKDAQEKNPINWVSNTDLTNLIRVIDSKHTLLIADACFSGGIFKTRSAFKDNLALEKLYELPSRKAMTSGTLIQVPDRSVFMKYLIKRMEENKESYLTAEQLFTSFRIAVVNNNGPLPQYGTIQNVGDEGGDFIFLKK